MLAKCANPSCPASFRYLKEGRLFRLEADLTPAPANMSVGDPGKTEYFWLCSHCSKTVTLRLGEGGTVVATALPDYAHQNPEDFAIISRQGGKLLRSVTFARREKEDCEGSSTRNSRS
jgi:hypothetical protein